MYPARQSYMGIMGRSCRRTMKVCSIEGCTKPKKARGWCTKHYKRWYKYGDPLVLKETPPKRARPPCSVEGCESTSRARGWCDKHYQRWRVHGDPEAGRRIGPSRCIHPDGCSKEVRSYGWCQTHAARIRRNGVPGPAGLVRKPATGDCKHPDGCLKPAYARGWCRFHYQRVLASDAADDPGPVGRVQSVAGDGYTNPQGYRMISPYGDGRRVPEHRHVMQQVLCRPLRDDENVHHINGIRDDNRPENLELWVKAQPAGQRAADLAEWVVDTYPELVAAVLADRRELRLIEGEAS